MTAAIFLSYASQDADAARRICDALRAAGLEVWFDQSELRGGDAWDASIRKQIKECALFVPIISANTQEREEGYFRLEWKLAVDRSHLMAENKAFFFPVILGDVPEAQALVPDKFRERQWTRLNDDVAINAFAERITKVQAGWASSGKNASSRPSSGEFSESAAPAKIVAPAVDGAATPATPARRRTIAALATIGAAAVGLAIWRPWRESGSGNNGIPRDPQLRKAVELISSRDATASEVATAEELTKAVLTAKPGDFDAIVVMARVQSYGLLRGFDRSPERLAVVQRVVERALTLAPNDPEAMFAMAVYLQRSRADLPRAMNLVREAIKLRPDDSRLYRFMGNVMSSILGVTQQEVVNYAQATADRFPTDPLVAYDLSLHYRRAGMLEKSEQQLERAIEFGPIPNAILVSAQNKLYLNGDVAGMKARLDQLPERFRGTEKAVISRFSYALMSREPQIGLDALRAINVAWMTDFEYTGPTALLAGELFLMQGKPTFAMQRFEEAAAELTRRKAESISNILLLGLDVWVQMRLGNTQVANAKNQILSKEIPRPFALHGNFTPLFNPIFMNLLLGQRATALALLGEATRAEIPRRSLSNLFRLDPRLEKFQSDPDIQAILATAAKPK